MAGYIYRLSYVPSYRRKTLSLSVDFISLQVWKNLLDSVFSSQKRYQLENKIEFKQRAG